MAKQCYEKKNIIKLIGRLDKSDDGEYFVSVEGKDSVEEYTLTDILDSMIGSIIDLQSEEAL